MGGGGGVKEAMRASVKENVGSCGESHLASASNKNPLFNIYRSSAAQTKEKKHSAGYLPSFFSLFRRNVCEQPLCSWRNARHNEKAGIQKEGICF